MITSENNMCRVFRLPNEYPSEYCFGGGVPVGMIMVDWFHPCPTPMSGGDAEVSREKWEDYYKPQLIDFIKTKRYYVETRTYLVITEFDDAFIIRGKD